MDQAELETVVPQPGGTVLVLNGPHRGLKGTLQGIDTKRFQVGGGQGGLQALGQGGGAELCLSVWCCAAQLEAAALAVHPARPLGLSMRLPPPLVLIAAGGGQAAGRQGRRAQRVAGVRGLQPLAGAAQVMRPLPSWVNVQRCPHPACTRSDHFMSHPACKPRLGFEP